MTEFAFGSKTFTTNRIIGEIKGESGGPNIVFIGGIHGNEPSGVVALQNVFRELELNGTSIRGRVMAVAGNLAALARGVRFIDADLNRLWTVENIHALATESADPRLESLEEFRELKELHSIFQPVFKNTPEAIFLDLHTTSSKSVPFIGVNDFPGSREFASNFSPPTILGLDSWLEGPLLSYASTLGHTAMAFEAGQHEDPHSADVHEAFIYRALVASGAIDDDQISDHAVRLESVMPLTLTHANPDPHLFEVIYRHHVDEEDGFCMVPGFENLAPVQKGELVAESHAGEILAPENGLMFMPLYQPVGCDGFFLVRPVPS